MHLALSTEELGDLNAVMDMAAEHVEDIEGGVADGTYAPEENTDLPAKSGAVERVRGLVDRSRKAAVEAQSRSDEIAEARETYTAGTEDIEIDDEPAVSVAEDESGVWVQAWLWVPHGS